MSSIRRVLLAPVLLVFIIAVAGCGGAARTSGPKVNPQASLDSRKAAYLVTAAWLKDNLKRVVVLDARKDAEYKAGHIPGAINAPWQSFANMNGKPGDKNWGTVLPKEQLAAKLGAIGIDGKKPVVVYTAPNGWGEDGRVVWMLRMAGIKDAKMLDGGWKAWTDAKYQVSQEKPAVTPVTCSITSMDESFVATTDWIKANLGRIKLVDARTTKEYNGATDFGEARGGHLPGAISLPFQRTFNADGTVKSSAELQALFTKAGLRPEDEIVTYCTKGIRSAHLALLLRMTGFEKVRNYDASFYEWAGDPSLKLEQ